MFKKKKKKLPGPVLAEQHLFHPLMLDPAKRMANEAMIRGLCHTVPIDASTTLARALGRYKIYLDTHDMGLSPHLMLDGFWEMWLTEALARALHPGMTVIDVGANLGYFTLMMADLVGPGGLVAAFEPNPPTAARLRLSARVNGYGGHVQVHEVLLGDTDGALYQLIVPDGEPMNSYMIPASRPESEGDKLQPTRRLDSFPELLDADVIKIDADTAERSIWHGMRGIFDRGRALTIFLEFNQSRYPDPDAFLAEIEREAFRFERVDPAAGLIAVTAPDILLFSETDDQILMLRREASH